MCHLGGDTAHERVLHASLSLDGGNLLTGSLTFSGSEGNTKKRYVITRSDGDEFWKAGDHRYSRESLLQCVDRLSPYRYEIPQQTEIFDMMRQTGELTDGQLYEYILGFMPHAEMPHTTKSYRYHNLHVEPVLEDRSFTRLDQTVGNNGEVSYHTRVGMPYTYNDIPGVLIVEANVDPIGDMELRCRFSGADYSNAEIKLHDETMVLRNFLYFIHALYDEKMGINKELVSLDNELGRLLSQEGL